MPQVALFLRALGCKLQSCMFATNGGIAQVDKLRSKHMSGCSYVIERMMQSSPLLREGGLRNDVARAAL